MQVTNPSLFNPQSSFNLLHQSKDLAICSDEFQACAGSLVVPVLRRRHTGVTHRSPVSLARSRASKRSSVELANED